MRKILLKTLNNDQPFGKNKKTIIKMKILDFIKTKKKSNKSKNNKYSKLKHIVKQKNHNQEKIIF